MDSRFYVFRSRVRQRKISLGMSEDWPTKRSIKDSRLITAGLCSPKASNIIACYQTPPLFLFFNSDVAQLLERASVVRGRTRLRLVSESAKLKFTNGRVIRRSKRRY